MRALRESLIMRVELLWAETANCTAMYIANNFAVYMLVNEGNRNFLTMVLLQNLFRLSFLKRLYKLLRGRDNVNQLTCENEL